MKSGNPLFNRLILLVVSPTIFALVWIFYFFYNTFPSQHFFHFLPPSYSLTISILLSLIILLLFNFFNNKFAVSTKQVSLPILLFALYFIPYTDTQLMIQLISYFLLISVFYQILSSVEKHNKYIPLFNASFIIGLISIFNTSFIIFFLLIIFSFFIYRNNKWRNWVLSFLGVLLPFFLFYMFSFIFSFNIVPLNNIEFKFSIIKFSELSNLLIIFFITYFLLIVFSIINILWNFSKQKIKVRYIFLFYFSLILICFIGFIIFSENKSFFLIIAAFPYSVLISNYLRSVKNTFLRIVFILIIFLLPVAYYFG